MFERRLQRGGYPALGAVVLLAWGFVCSPCQGVWADMPSCLHQEDSALVCEGTATMAPLGGATELAPAPPSSTAPPSVGPLLPPVTSGLTALLGGPVPHAPSGAQLVLLHQALLR